jgi:hypothetical protein
VSPLEVFIDDLDWDNRADPTDDATLESMAERASSFIIL